MIGYILIICLLFGYAHVHPLGLFLLGMARSHPTKN
jgi:hypothetical protein